MEKAYNPFEEREKFETLLMLKDSLDKFSLMKDIEDQRGRTEEAWLESFNNRLAIASMNLELSEIYLPKEKYEQASVMLKSIAAEAKELSRGRIRDDEDADIVPEDRRDEFINKLAQINELLFG